MRTRREARTLRWKTILGLRRLRRWRRRNLLKPLRELTAETNRLPRSMAGTLPMWMTEATRRELETQLQDLEMLTAYVERKAETLAENLASSM